MFYEQVFNNLEAKNNVTKRIYKKKFENEAIEQQIKKLNGFIIKNENEILELNNIKNGTFQKTFRNDKSTTGFDKFTLLKHNFELTQVNNSIYYNVDFWSPH